MPPNELGRGHGRRQHNRAIVSRHLERRARHQPQALPDSGRNYHPACLVDGSYHAIIIPLQWHKANTTLGLFKSVAGVDI